MKRIKKSLIEINLKMNGAVARNQSNGPWPINICVYVDMHIYTCIHMYINVNVYKQQ